MPEILFHLSGQMGGVVVQAVHELGLSQLLVEHTQVLPGGFERLGRIGDAGSIQRQIVRAEGPLESKPKCLDGVGRHLSRETRREAVADRDYERV